MPPSWEVERASTSKNLGKKDPDREASVRPSMGDEGSSKDVRERGIVRANRPESEEARVEASENLTEAPEKRKRLAASNRSWTPQVRHQGFTNEGDIKTKKTRPTSRYDEETIEAGSQGAVYQDWNIPIPYEGED